MIAPVLLVHRVIPGMIARDYGRIVNITSALVTTPRPHMSLLSGSRAGLEFGATCAFLCSTHAGFMSGQDIHLNGGSYPALI